MNLIRSLIALIYAISLIYMLLDCEVKNKNNLFLMGLFVTVVLICDGLIWANFGYASFLKLYPLLIHVPSFIAFLFVSKYKGIKLIFILLTVFVLCTPPIGVGLITSSFFGFNSTILCVVSIIMYIPTGFIVYKYLRPSFLYMLRYTDKGWFGFCTIPLSYYALIYFIGMYNVKNATMKSILVIMVLALILTLSAYIMILQLFKQTREQLTLQNEQNLLKTQLTSAQVYLEALKESQKKTIIYRHDMRHHLNLISAYLSGNNKEAAQKYITEIEKNIEGTIVETYCDNYTVNLILYYYLTKAKKEQIKVETCIKLPQKSSISDMDFCIIFANAIENAVNACKDISREKKRIIKVICKTKNDKVLIQITNSYEGTVMFVDDLPVNEMENHGIGTRSIAALAQKYDGVYSFTAENGLFKTSIILSVFVKHVIT
ncbi:GHKL domain-containing protein [Clostridium sp. PL3]|uniref:GHKL domain-containing protein n=1 Tax=Clostridium thailandense TaxID=2794346 RepID=A0A949TNK5_9CLOT|nr:sensor histidine kinase [Clostridium thailandense]MBV7276144.1 GHKL domain-containing protein [Clostridium thailandense]